MLRFALILGGLTWCAAGQGSASGRVPADATEQRFHVSGQLQSLLTSSCGRFALQAKVRHQPAAQSIDGRYALKAVHVPAGGCEAQGDALFVNGFESS